MDARSLLAAGTPVPATDPSEHAVTIPTAVPHDHELQRREQLISVPRPVRGIERSRRLVGSRPRRCVCSAPAALGGVLVVDEYSVRAHSQPSRDSALGRDTVYEGIAREIAQVGNT